MQKGIEFPINSILSFLLSTPLKMEIRKSSISLFVSHSSIIEDEKTERAQSDLSEKEQIELLQSKSYSEKLKFFDRRWRLREVKTLNMKNWKKKWMRKKEMLHTEL